MLGVGPVKRIVHALRSIISHRRRCVLMLYQFNATHMMVAIGLWFFFRLCVCACNDHVCDQAGIHDRTTALPSPNTCSAD